jgi:hypothetical protein
MSTLLLRISGWLLLFGGLLMAVTNFHLPVSPVAAALINLLGDVLLLLGLPALYARQATQVRWIGWADHHLARCPNLPSPARRYRRPDTCTHTSCLPVYHRTSDDHWDTVLWHHDHAGRSLSRLARLLPLREVSPRYLFFC